MGDENLAARPGDLVALRKKPIDWAVKERAFGGEWSRSAGVFGRTTGIRVERRTLHFRPAGESDESQAGRW